MGANTLFYPLAEGKNSAMRVGDIVKVRDHVDINVHRFFGLDTLQKKKETRVGLIIDCQEMYDGFCEYEVIFEGWSSWFRDLELEVLNEQDIL